MNEAQPPLQTELSRSPTPGELVPVDKKHQFDGAKFNYQRASSRLVIWIAIVIVGLGAVVAFLLFTDAGKNLLGIGGQTSSQTSSQSLTSADTDSTSSAALAPERNFEDSTTEQVVDALTSDFDQGEQQLNAETDFGDFDAELEFGL
jgi:hypothetical protein